MAHGESAKIKNVLNEFLIFPNSNINEIADKEIISDTFSEINFNLFDSDLLETPINMTEFDDMTKDIFFTNDEPEKSNTQDSNNSTLINDYLGIYSNNLIISPTNTQNLPIYDDITSDEDILPNNMQNLPTCDDIMSDEDISPNNTQNLPTYDDIMSDEDIFFPKTVQPPLTKPIKNKIIPSDKMSLKSTAKLKSLRFYLDHIESSATNRSQQDFKRLELLFDEFANSFN